MFNNEKTAKKNKSIATPEQNNNNIVFLRWVQKHL